MARVRDVLEAETGVEPEYVTLVHPDTLEPEHQARDGSVLLLAVRIGETRLIDNTFLGAAV